MGEKEYIDREVAIKIVGNIDTLNSYDDIVDEVIAAIQIIPAADVVPVVRCKDCIHWLNEEGLEDHVCLKIYSDGAVSSYAWQHRNPDDFCSYGERMGG